MVDTSKGQLFSSTAAPVGALAGQGEQEKPTYQPAATLPGEGSEYDVLAFDMAAAGFEPVHWTRPKTDLRFVMRQTTIPDYCRAIRLAMADGAVVQDQLARNLFKSAIIRIGETENPSEDFIDAWLDDLRSVGAGLVDRAYGRLCQPSIEVNKAFDAAKSYEPASRSYSFEIPISVLPAAYVERVDTGQRDRAGKPVTARKAKDTAPALAFTMRELNFNEMAAAADACDDPDDAYAIRVLRVMWAISSIGGKALGNSAADLLYRRQWIARIGHPAWMMIAGTWTRMHEVDRGLVDRFLDAACAPA